MYIYTFLYSIQYERFVSDPDDVNSLQRIKFSTIVNLNLLGLPSLDVKFT